MRVRPLILTALGAVFVLGAAAPAFADYDDWRRHEWREHQAREWHERHRGYYAPPVVVAPPYRPYYAPPPVYYAPPPAYYAQPGMSFGFTVR